jgi:hypothetical protein
MSEMEFHTGRFRIFPRLPGEEDIKYARRFLEGKQLAEKFGEMVLSREEGDSAISEEAVWDIFQDLAGPWRRQSFIATHAVDGRLILDLPEHTYAESAEDGNLYQPLQDGTVRFTTGFYNGGTCLSEVLGKAAGKLPSGGRSKDGDTAQLEKYLDDGDFDAIVQNGLVPKMAARMTSAEAFRKGILDRLNEALQLDREALVKLMLHTEACNDALRASGVCIDSDSAQASLLGILMHRRPDLANTFAVVTDVEPTEMRREVWIPEIIEFACEFTFTEGEAK